MEPHINKDTQLCMSLSARPGNLGTRFHNYLYRELGLNFVYKAFTTQDLASTMDELVTTFSGFHLLSFCDTRSGKWV